MPVTDTGCISQNRIILYEDTRQKNGSHDLKHQYFAKKGVEIVRSKLYAGDYSLIQNGLKSVDSKQNLQELVGDLVQDHARFADECDRAYQHGIALAILVENRDGIRSVDDIHTWKNPRYQKWLKHPTGRSPTSSETLEKMVKTFSDHHKVKFYFCKPESSGRAIIWLLTGIDLGE